MEDTLQIRDVTLTMYAGTLNKISEAIGGMSGLDKLAYDNEIQTALVKSVLKKYDEEGNEKGYLITPFTLSPEEFEKILDWGTEHFMVFTLKSSKRMVDKLKTMETEIKGAAKDLKLTQNG